MGKRGPPPKPTRLRVLEGNPSKRALNDREPEPPAGLPRCPKELDRAARAEWRRVGSALEEMGVVTQVDGAVLAAYCALYSRWLQAESQIKKHGMLVRSPNGHLTQSPYLNIANRCLEKMRGFLQELGLTPASRSQVAVLPSGTAGRNPFLEDAG